MPLTIIVGGFFGDEGKGKICGYLALADKPFIGVRTGSINAGHTVAHKDRIWKLRIIPSFFINKSTRLLIAPGALIRLDVLWREINETEALGRVFLDRNTGVIEETHVEEERRDQYLSSFIGSTLQGVGAAMRDRVLRKLKIARDYYELRDLIIDVSEEVNKAVDRGERVYVEGTQGTFLSLYHGTYPYVTSRDTTASGVASEVGVGPKKIDDVIIVFKSYVTRVGEGPLPNEYSTEEILRRGLIEKGTVTGRLRRVAPFNMDLAKKAVEINTATQIAITKLDVLFPETRGAREWSRLSPEAKKWIDEIESFLKRPVSLIGTGEDIEQTIDLRKDLGLLR